MVYIEGWQKTAQDTMVLFVCFCQLLVFKWLFNHILTKSDCMQNCSLNFQP